MYVLVRCARGSACSGLCMRACVRECMHVYVREYANACIVCGIMLHVVRVYMREYVRWVWLCMGMYGVRVCMLIGMRVYAYVDVCVRMCVYACGM